ncbi:oligopeptide transport system ATP-binding protein [Tistlia consotensis]|uniref:Glutathione import ATP-binding protein GsiA n=1 Tax=Tistlia consotensis USBA 355 TaxID=560819 RepID=A0A1Y6BZL4_9PROT|nr:oligopeptide/dipeptide ABC transporter ATP-binding protein [Tistlia consotensis]SMF36517.1 oligopeptide transport system ATP-binding protein [Tistlia consotensis USBA 355]SNR72039.1 oligopeptide transport system ATP-binding protein [Tistlia consotensis]
MSTTASDPVLEIDRLSVRFPVKHGLFGLGRREVHAVEDFSLTIRRGETIGIVGESGCGKSTLARTIMGLNTPAAGSLRFRPQDRSLGPEGLDLAKASSADWKKVRRKVQIVFQDPFSSLSPKQKVGSIVAEPLIVQGPSFCRDPQARAVDLLERVGLSRRDFDRYPHEFSGGQRQRIMIARAIALDPEVLIADEAVSALDVSIRLQIITLLDELKEVLGLTLIFISHDLGVVRVVSDRIAIMYLGRLAEVGANREVFAAPRHPYTRMLLASTPIPDPDRRPAEAPAFGELPSPIDPPPGCVFHPRCGLADATCRQIVPPPVEVAPGHRARCHHTGAAV